MSHLEHQQQSAAIVPHVAILTLSDTRTLETDVSGDAIASGLRTHGCTIAERALIRDDADALRDYVNRWLADTSVDAIITTGGTGIAPRDQTIDVVVEAFDVELPGFGEIFRMLSWQQVGAAAMMSRAAAGIAKGKPIFALPGSTNAVTLAIGELIGPQLKHIIGQLRKAP